jgi:hypothetical protein
MPQAIEKRKSPRVRRRMQVIFDHNNTLRAQTTNVSMTGMCIASDYIAVPGTQFLASVTLPDGNMANFEAVVIWARKVRAKADFAEKNTMGLEFIIPPGEHYNAVISAALDGTASKPATAAAVRSTAPAVRRTGHTTRPMTPVAGPAAPVPTPSAAPAPSPKASPIVSPKSTGVDRAVGKVGMMEAKVKLEDLAAPSDIYPCSISPARAAEWIEKAAVRGVASSLPPGSVSVGVALQIEVKPFPPVRIGCKVATTAKLTGFSPDGKRLIFKFGIDDGEQLIASGRHERMIILQRGG